MAKRELSSREKKFKELAKNILTEALYWDNTCQVWISFPKENEFHIHIIEDYCSHMHIRGTIDDGVEVRSTHSALCSGTTRDALDAMDEIIDNFE